MKSKLPFSIKSVTCIVLLTAASVMAVTDTEIQNMRQAMPTKPVVKAAQPRTMLVFSLCKGFKHSSIPYWAKALDVMSETTGFVGMA